MNIRFHSPVIITNKLEDLKNFYCEVLQQAIEHDFGSCIVFECGLSIWAVSTMHPVAKVAEPGVVVNKNLELCFETEQFEEVYLSLKKHDLNLLHDIIEEPWGQRTIRFFDPDKNLIEMGESIPCFVCRMYNSGMSIKEIVAKTSVSEENVKTMVGIKR